MNTQRRSALAFALAGLILNAGCGGGSSTPSTSSTPTPVPAPVTTTLGQGTYQGPSGATGPVATFTINVAGTVTTTLRWTFASNDVDLFVLSGTTCATHAGGVPSGAGCTILCRDVAVGGTTATCSYSSTIGTGLVWATNYGSTSESGTWIVTLTR